MSSPNNSFTERVLVVVTHIPPGRTMTYRQVAEAAGSPRAARAVGSIMKQNYNPNIPCHRVVKSDGSLGEYNRGADEKRRKLEQEGAIAEAVK
ncbi:MAG: MGMT family protein [Candidatus Andersenbacteria bacterium]